MQRRPCRVARTWPTSCPSAATPPAAARRPCASTAPRRWRTRWSRCCARARGATACLTTTGACCERPSTRLTCWGCCRPAACRALPSPRKSFWSRHTGTWDSTAAWIRASTLKRPACSCTRPARVAGPTAAAQQTRAPRTCAAAATPTRAAAAGWRPCCAPKRRAQVRGGGGGGACVATAAAAAGRGLAAQQLAHL